MTFRVITSGADQGATGMIPARSPVVRPQSPSGQVAVPQTGTAPDPGAVGHLLDRLESLSFTFEALNASSRTYASEAILETLARMERRDLQALAAIEAFASALKTVSQHLAGLRNAVQSSAHDTAAGFDHIGQRLARLEQRSGAPSPVTAGDSAILGTIAERLNHIEQLIEDGAEAMLPSVDLTPLNSQLQSIALHVSRVEDKIDAIPPAATSAAIDLGPLNEVLHNVAQRVLRIEQRLETAPTAPAPVEPAGLGALHEVLTLISARLAAVESRAEMRGDLAALEPFLDAVDRRLRHMEDGLGLGTDRPAGTPPPPSPADERSAAPDPAPVAVAVPGTGPSAEQRQRVDSLLEQVFRVLSR
jgi:hypothetical protein